MEIARIIGGHHHCRVAAALGERPDIEASALMRAREGMTEIALVQIAPAPGGGILAEFFRERCMGLAKRSPQEFCAVSRSFMDDGAFFLFERGKDGSAISGSQQCSKGRIGRNPFQESRFKEDAPPILQQQGGRRISVY